MLHRFICVAFALMPLSGYAQRPPIERPSNAQTVLERLPRGYSALTPAMNTTQAPIEQINQLLTTSARTGDMRLAARAEELLDRLPVKEQSTAVLKARAFTAQHRHAFDDALRLLDKVIARDPRDADARFSRAQIQLVRGRISRARKDCAALGLGIDVSQGLICLAAVSMRTGDLKQAMHLADRWLALGHSDKSFRRYVLVLRAEAASRAQAADADQWFDRALALDRQDVRTLSAYARHLYGDHRPREVLALLANAPQTDGLSLQLALAAKAANAPQATTLAQSQSRRYATAHAVGVEPELRDEAEFLLTLRNDAVGALKLAQRNFETQRDYEDVDLLRRAAFAAKRPDALKPLMDWADSQHLALPMMPSAAQ